MAKVETGIVVQPAGGEFLFVGRLQVPRHIATGNYEKLSDEELNEHAADIAAEFDRRRATPVS